MSENSNEHVKISRIDLQISQVKHKKSCRRVVHAQPDQMRADQGKCFKQIEFLKLFFFPHFFWVLSVYLPRVIGRPIF